MSPFYSLGIASVSS